MCSPRRFPSAQSTTLRANVRGRANLRYAGVLVVLAGMFDGTLHAQSPADVAVPRNTIAATFVPASTVTFPNQTDSNSPAVWDGQDFYVFNSAGNPRRARGTRIEDAVDTNPGGASSSYTDDFGYGRWLEAVLRDDDTG